MENERIAHNTATPSEQPPRLQPAGLGRLAERITSYTSKGIVSAVILVAGLGFGRQVLLWWGDTPPVPLPATEESRVDARSTDGGRVVRVGEHAWSMRIHSVAGGADEAAAKLRAACRALADATAPAGRAAGEAEQTLLARLDDAEPCETGPHGWELFEIRQGVLLAVATLTGPPTADEEGSLVVPRRRVVTWGLALPRTEVQWSVYTFQPDTVEKPETTGRDHVMLPLGVRRTLAMETPGRGELVAFEGEAAPATWKAYFEESLTRQGYRPLGVWRCVSDSWHLRCRGTGQQSGSSVDVHLGQDESGATAGLLVLAEDGALDLTPRDEPGREAGPAMLGKQR